ncbi:MAG: hypothetical protein EA408_13020 [Marinilabiliales bacterium]|nr:MAG: hypothetical protein EA408_13020 [Marinilabiliales bacterium]
MLVSCLPAQSSLAGNITREQERLALDGARQVLYQYQEYASFTEDGERISQDYTDAFLGLFSDPQRDRVFNDAAERARRGSSVTARDYVGYIHSNYPSGLDVILETGEISLLGIESLPGRDGAYQMKVSVHKELFGLTLSRRLHEYSGTLVFAMEFMIDDDSPSGFVITGISDQTGHVNYLADQRLRGLHLGVSGEMAGSMMLSADINDNSHWQQTPQREVSFGASVTWFFNRSVGLTIGANMVRYSAGLSLDNFSGQSDIEIIDKDDDIYNPVFEISDLTELNTLEYIEIPLMLNLRTGKASTGIYLDAGIVYAISQKAGYRVEGVVNRMGYYQEYDITLEDVPEYGFAEVALDEAGSWQVNPTNIAAIARVGLSIPITAEAYLRIGGVGIFGLNDILYDRPKHPEDFISTTGIVPGETRLARFGVEIGFSYKLF